jgi:hypothetical protein
MLRTLSSTSSSEPEATARQTSQFLAFARSFMLLILLPTLILILILIGPLEWAAWRVGATMPPSVIAQAQMRTPGLLWAGDVPYYLPIRLELIKIQKPDVVFLGTSRCSEFRGTMMKPYRAFNSCTSAGSIDQTSEVIQDVIQAAHPKIIVFAIDYFMFTQAWAEGVPPRMAMERRYDFRWHLNGLIRTAEFAVAQPFRILRALVKLPREPLDGNTLIGINAIRDGWGFRVDGSVMYAQSWKNQAPVHNTTRTFGVLSDSPGAPNMAASQIKALRRLAEIGKSNDVKLVAMVMPMLGLTVDYLDHEESYHYFSGIWREFESDDTRRMMKEFGLMFFNFAHFPGNWDPRNFVDSAHPSERVMLAALLNAFRTDPEFRATFPQLDVGAMQQDLDGAERDGAFFDVYHNRF